MLQEKIILLIKDEIDAIAKYQDLLLDMKNLIELDSTRIKLTNFLKDEQKHLKRLNSVLSFVSKIQGFQQF